MSEDLSKEEGKELEKLMRMNNHVFTWTVNQMPEIDPKDACTDSKLIPKLANKVNTKENGTRNASKSK